MTKDEFKNQLTLNMSPVIWKELHNNGEYTNKDIAIKINFITSYIADECFVREYYGV